MENELQPVEGDQSREGLTFGKFFQALRLFWPANTKTLAHLNKFTDLDVDKIRELTGVEIKGIILDVDGCVAYNHENILPENVEHLQKLIAHGIRIVVYSNMAKTSRYDVFDGTIEVLTNIPPKPEPAGFELACGKLGLPKENIVMIGDNYLTDGGAIRAGINFIEVKPLRKPDQESLAEKVHNFLRSIFRGISRVHDLGRKTNK